MLNRRAFFGTAVALPGWSLISGSTELSRWDKMRSLIDMFEHKLADQFRVYILSKDGTRKLAKVNSCSYPSEESVSWVVDMQGIEVDRFVIATPRDQDLAQYSPRWLSGQTYNLQFGIGSSTII